MKRGIDLFILIVCLLSLTIISASTLGIFVQDTTIGLHQVCDNCTFVNLTSIRFPNGTIDVINSGMTKVENDYNFTFSNTNSPGLYSYNTCGDQDGSLVCENIDFVINRLGEELTTGKSIVYILLTFFVFVLFVFVFWINVALPIGNERDQKGNITRIIKKKYIKIALIPVTHSLFNLFLNLLLSISNNLVGRFNIYTGMISFIFLVSIRLAWPLIVVTIVWFFFVWIRDLNWNKMIKKFGKVPR